MAKRYSREEFLGRLRNEIRQGKPLVMTGAGNGIAAKFIEQGGVDIIGIYNTGYFRMQGYGSLAGMLRREGRSTEDEDWPALVGCVESEPADITAFDHGSSVSAPSSIGP